MNAEFEATRDTLVANGCPVRVITFERFDAKTLGALFMQGMLETYFAAEFLGVNAFDQPAVEEGKKLALRYLAEKNFSV